MQAKADIFKAWQRWCQRNGDVFPNSMEVFSRNLQAAANGRVTATKVRSGGKRVPAFKGIRLREDQTEDATQDFPF